ncbi:MAG: glucose 1-dehydrogenase [Planctomycetota bacterium]
MARLENKVAVVTGGNSGIGFATAKRFVEEGARVIITGRRADAVEKAAKDLGGNVVGLVADASTLADTDKLVEQLKEHTDHVDVLFLNAGIAPMAPLTESDEAMFDSTFNTNVKGPLFTIQKALPLLKGGSSVFINASVVTDKGLTGSSIYSASKGAVRTMVRVLAAELAPHGIRVNALSPGPIGTPLWSKTGMSEEDTQGMGEQLGKTVPLGRFGEPEEMAGVAVFLASDDSSYVTGADIQADGGFAQV